ncbi:flavodoxin domain-containing protein [Teredinibacter waterburyi]|uniref:flavodoxin domain-containing protein n=1 Tax=Teredinibacter waterburyi TaxID=1500538 RepID=UPI00165FB036|nr:flavodoxin domain-containing protein [Teredinibacter waterburyi]
MATIHIIVGSVMGTAEALANWIANELQSSPLNVRVNREFKAGELFNSADEVVLVCTSNTGMGDLPQNIQPLLTHIGNDYPAIAGRGYGIINLGDSSYPNFAQAGQTLNEAFADIGATLIGEPLVIDALDDQSPEQLCSAWLSSWVDQVNGFLEVSR